MDDIVTKSRSRGIKLHQLGQVSVLTSNWRRCIDFINSVNKVGLKILIVQRPNQNFKRVNTIEYFILTIRNVPRFYNFNLLVKC